MGFFTRTNHQKARDKVRVREGFRRATDAELWGPFADMRAYAQSLVSLGRVSELELLYRQTLQSGAFVGAGRRVYDYVLHWVTSPKPEDTPATLEALGRQYQEVGGPFWAGVYAEALMNAGYLARGTGYASQVTQEGGATFAQMMAYAGAILDENSARGAAEYPWLSAQLTSAMNQGDRELLAERFEALYAFDRGNLNTLRTRGIQLMPRWFGTGPEDAEALARRAVEETHEMFGYGAYCAVYSAYVNTADLEVTDTHLDPALLKRSFEDLYSRFGGLRVLNDFACAMNWVGDYPTVKGIFAVPLRAIDVTAWTSGDPEKWGMEYAVAAYITAD